MVAAGVEACGDPGSVCHSLLAWHRAGPVGQVAHQDGGPGAVSKWARSAAAGAECRSCEGPRTADLDAGLACRQERAMRP